MRAACTIPMEGKCDEMDQEGRNGQYTRIQRIKKEHASYLVHIFKILPVLSHIDFSLF